MANGTVFIVNKVFLLYPGEHFYNFFTTFTIYNTQHKVQELIRTEPVISINTQHTEVLRVKIVIIG